MNLTSVTLLIFGRMFGFLGVLLSVPLAAITKILCIQFIMPLVREFASEREPADQPPPELASGPAGPPSPSDPG